MSQCILTTGLIDLYSFSIKSKKVVPAIEDLFPYKMKTSGYVGGLTSK